ncbi:MAG: glycosyltransferase family 2 protein [Patescibacteria group bacterium]
MVPVTRRIIFYMLLSIVILNYKKPRLTLACTASLYKFFSKELDSNTMEIIIVDNHSEDESVVLFEKEIKKQGYTNCHIIANKANDGFSKGCNLGAKTAKGSYFLFLNNDTLVEDKSIENMIKYLDQHNEVAILGGQLLNADRSKQASVGSFYTPARATALLLGMQRVGAVDTNPKEVTRVDWVKGALFLIRAEVFKELNGFDEHIFMYAEDMELCYRAHKKGYATYFYPFCSVLHAEHGSTNRSFAIIQIYKSLLYFYKKHRSYREYLYIKALLITKAKILVLAGTILHKQYLTSTYEKALSVV